MLTAGRVWLPERVSDALAAYGRACAEEQRASHGSQVCARLAADAAVEREADARRVISEHLYPERDDEVS